MKKKVVLCSAALLAANYQSANAMDFGDKFYGKAQIGVGYDNRFYQGEVKEFTKEADLSESVRANLVSGGIFLNTGYNIYYKLSNIFHPFVGLNAYAKLPVFGKTAAFADDDRYKEKLSFNEYFGFNAKLGTKVNFTKDFALEPYALIGLNLSKEKYKFKYSNSYVSEQASGSAIKTGLITGAGADAVFSDRFIAGLEYRYGVTKFGNLDLDSDSFVPSFKVKTHTVAFKFGVQFL